MKTMLSFSFFKPPIILFFAGLIFETVLLNATPVIKQYSISNLSSLISDLNAGNADIFELTESGDYTITSAAPTIVTLAQSVTIRAASNLTKRPVLKLNAPSLGEGTRFFYVNAPSLTVDFEGIEFDGYNAESAIQPILLDADWNSANLQINIRNCYLHNFENALSGSNSIIVMKGIMASLNIQDSHINNSKGKLFYFRSTTESDEPSTGDLILRNNIFSNFSDNTTYVFFYQANSPTDHAKGNNIQIDHCTFYNIIPNRTFTTRKFYGTAEFKNSIFVNVAERGFNIWPVSIDYCYLSGIAQYSETIPSGTRSNIFDASPAPAFVNPSNLDFTLMNPESFICGDGFVAGYNEGGVLSSVPSVLYDDMKLYLDLGSQGLTSRIECILKIYTVDGRVLKSEKLERGQLVNLNPGIYIIHLSVNEKSFVRKIQI